MATKLSAIIDFRGILRVGGSGLRIGGSDENSPIGEIDNPIIRHPITRLPYVPGSSIKGKVRSLLESKYCPYTQKEGVPCNCGDCEVCQLFGCGQAANTKSPTRLVFRDCQPTDATKETWIQAGLNSEVKVEVMINRTTGTTTGPRTGGERDRKKEGAPRKMERIPAGSDFEFAFSLRYFEGDDLRKYFETVAEGFELLEKHYLGGSGSRGYGQVSLVAADGTPMADHLRQRAKGLAS